MVERLRSVTVTVTVDTNKRTESQTFEGDTAMEDAQDWLDDLYQSIN